MMIKFSKVRKQLLRAMVILLGGICVWELALIVAYMLPADI
jgi:hypothetical protein